MKLIDLLNEKASQEGIDLKTLCDRLLKDYEHGLNLIKRNTGKSEFVITGDVISDPNGTLDKWVKKYYTAVLSEA